MAGDAGVAGRGRAVPWRWLGWGAIAALLLTPAVAMRITPEVRWTASDFLVAAALLGSLGVGVELAVRASGDNAYRTGAALAVLTAFATAWINLAVGIIGAEGNAANLLFFGVLGVALAGAVVARFRARGMAAAMAATALAQALAIWPAARDSAQAAVLTAVLAAAWLASAALFATARRDG